MYSFGGTVGGLCQQFRLQFSLELFDRGTDQGDSLSIAWCRGNRSCVEGIFLKLAESGNSPPPRGEFDPLLTSDERRALRHVRHALHADELSLPHPSSGERMRFSAPLPHDLRKLIGELRPLDGRAALELA